MTHERYERRHFTPTAGGQPERRPFRAESETNPVLREAFAQLAACRTPIWQAYLPVVAHVADLSQEWSAGDESWQRMLAALEGLQAPLAACLTWMRTSSYQLSQCLLAIRDPLMGSLARSIDLIEQVIATLKAPQWRIVLAKYRPQRAPVEELLRKLTSELVHVVELTGARGRALCRDAYAEMLREQERLDALDAWSGPEEEGSNQ